MPRVPLLMPKMSMTMEFGTVEEWLVEVGGPVTDGDAVVVVTTDKVDMDVESTCDGTLVEVLAQPGEQVPVGQPIAWIETEKDDLLGDLFAPAPAAEEPSSDPGASPSHPDPSTRHPGLAPGSRAHPGRTEIPASAGMTGQAKRYGGRVRPARSRPAAPSVPCRWPASWPPRRASTWLR